MIFISCLKEDIKAQTMDIILITAHDAHWRSRQISKIRTCFEHEYIFLELLKDIDNRIHKSVHSGKQFLEYSIVGMDKGVLDRLVQILTNRGYLITVDDNTLKIDWSKDPVLKNLKDPVLQMGFERMGVKNQLSASNLD